MKEREEDQFIENWSSNTERAEKIVYDFYTPLDAGYFAFRFFTFKILKFILRRTHDVELTYQEEER